MAVEFFGHYLIDEGILTIEQFAEVVEYQAEHNVSLGKLAVKEGLVSEDDALLINDKQKKLDERFGEVALNLNLLSQEQVEYLLKEQDKNRVLLGKALIDKNFISQDELDIELNKFEKLKQSDKSFLDKELAYIDSDDIIQNTLILVERIYLRLFHDNIKLQKIDCVEYSEFNGVSILKQISGDQTIDMICIASEEMMEYITKEYAMDNNKDKQSLDIFIEFVDIILEHLKIFLNEIKFIVDISSSRVINEEPLNFSEYFCFEFIGSHGRLVVCIDN